MAQNIVMVFRMSYRDVRCKLDAINALNAIEGVSAENDNKRGLLRDVTVSITPRADRELPGKMLTLFGVPNKKSVFKATFQDQTSKNTALLTVKALRDVVTAEYQHVDIRRNGYTNMPATLIVTGDVEPGIVLDSLRRFGTAQIF